MRKNQFERLSKLATDHSLFIVNKGNRSAVYIEARLPETVEYVAVTSSDLTCLALETMLTSYTFDFEEAFHSANSSWYLKEAQREILKSGSLQKYVKEFVKTEKIVNRYWAFSSLYSVYRILELETPFYSQLIEDVLKKFSYDFCKALLPELTEAQHDHYIDQLIVQMFKLIGCAADYNVSPLSDYY